MLVLQPKDLNRHRAAAGLKITSLPHNLLIPPAKTVTVRAYRKRIGV
jgi:hypothetical protein